MRPGLLEARPVGSLTPIPDPLARGAVRPGHILFLYAVIFVTVSIVGLRVGEHVDPTIRYAYRGILGQAGTAFLLILLSLAVPELRRSLPVLYGSSRAKLAAVEILIFVAAMLAWGYGAHRMLIVFPLLRWHPELFSLFGYYQHFPDVTASYIVLTIAASVIVAPFVEELLFRGYLLNLWRVRHSHWAAILLSSFFFGLAHLQWAAFAMLAGILLALVYLHFGSLWPGTFLHGLFNLCSCPFAFGHLFMEKSKSAIGLWTSWIPEIALSAAFVPLAVIFWRRFRPTR
jgi:membrane protease YdiL (CAAX protease family)